VGQDVGMTDPTSPSGDPGGAELLLADLDPEQREVVTAVHGPVLVVAGAGTGKTRAVTHRIAYGVRVGAFDASGVLAVTFTTRAAAEMRARLARLGVSGVATRTFHSAALSQVRYLWPRLYGREFADVLDNPDALLADLVAAAGLGVSVRDLATEISWAKVSNVAPQHYQERARQAGRRVSGADPSQVARLYTSYTDALAASDRVDLEDVLLAAVGMLSTQPAAARVVRQRYRWFTVDEFQDLSPLQMRLLECWLGERDDLCAVGDPRQAIYSFAGARPQLMDEFVARFPRATRLELTRNYRSTPQVLQVAAAVMATATTVPPASAPVLRPTRPDGAPVELRELPDQQAELADVAAAVRARIDAGTAARDIAVLTRTRAHVGPLMRALQRHGVPLASRGATPFYDRPEVRQALALLSAAARRGGQQGSGLTDVVRAVLTDAGWSPDRPDGAGRASHWDSWDTVVGVADDFERTLGAAGQQPASLTDLVAHLREQARTGAQPRGSGVTVATLHATKGQQWAAVFVVGAHDGGIPSRAALTRSAGPEAIAEERRLLYVGLTRAADHLCVTWARQASEQSPRRPPSRFLAALLTERPASVNIVLRGAPPTP
jgi:DNA helicase-2/ATP-dependent DNA helicase PcrA